MNIKNNSQLSYCSNIHPGESWKETIDNLKNYTTVVRDEVAPGKSFGIGLRLSNEASEELNSDNNIIRFREWLEKENMYVFTMNGFPYGGFHKQVVKDQVHAPDWTTPKRLAYTNRLFDILKELLPAGMEGGISTSPLSYRFWHETRSDLDSATLVSAKHMANTIGHLYKINDEQGVFMHLDVEPEPDGILENSTEVISFFKEYMLRSGVQYLVRNNGFSKSQAEEAVHKHWQLCYDVCHAAVGYEEPSEVVDKMKQQGIRIGKIQISAALKATWQNESDQKEIKKQLAQFDEEVYLHQSVLKKPNGKLDHYKDLSPALKNMIGRTYDEIRTHYHVPVFTENFGVLQSTQNEIVKSLEYWKSNPYSTHLEIETYTWDVLPEELRVSLEECVIREMKWTLGIINK
ncbi:MAG: metabolite traffic protein EboE [Cyclobacteriaceae bacterium]|nr:metabolite traffic protein EboE [Cyclobacteriaceae bacterium]